MIKPMNKILFATDLTPNCQQAYDYAISLSMRFQATVYLLYIIEPLPENVEGRIKGLLGQHRWEDITHTKEGEVRKSLTGKRTSAHVMSDIQEFCKLVGVGNADSDLQSREIIISDGNIVETIIETAEKNQCDLIVMGAHKGLLHRNSIGDSIKGVMRESRVPVTVVPTDIEGK
ncbi:Nucleotide-binding universal stress protein, UspA family [Desulforhopalus singaporensis]|uniref:Nucleotide-binding universal stress protein, UspA family n=2 Tax=Desulforhopalus singaporensis TaxID=91360 RepID=A0A1H0IVY1_9BACT|nr:Nucleotide-binding universal stress protein, UspA family [Desulforhopalus singaporensis]